MFEQWQRRDPPGGDVVRRRVRLMPSETADELMSQLAQARQDVEHQRRRADAADRDARSQRERARQLTELLERAWPHLPPRLRASALSLWPSENGYAVPSTNGDGRAVDGAPLEST